MLRVAEYYTGTDTGRQRRANEDALLARAPLFVVADGMGGAQAGEVASQVAIEAFEPGVSDGAHPERELAELARAANERIHELSHSNAEQAGMGTTLTAIYVGESEVAIAHVGDSRAYCLRDGKLLRLTDDHTLVDELMRQGRLTPEEAVEHPQRSVITRALGPEGAVDIDTRSFQARAGDVYLLCSDGLTTMVSEEDILASLLRHPPLNDAVEALIRAANDAGGRDNVTVLLIRLEEVGVAGAEESGSEQTVIGMAPVSPPTEPDTATHAALAVAPPVAETAAPEPAREAPAAPAETPGSAPAARRRMPRAPRTSQGKRRRRLPRLRSLGAVAVALVVLGLIGAGAYLAMQSVYFIGTNGRGLVTIYQGVPYQLPGGINLYTRSYVSGVSASTVPAARRKTLLNHHLHSEGDAASLVRSLELGQLE
jgi:protein phosphatase